ncbi:DUF4145 domain-containing protein [Streptomyces sp. NPDC015680]|uniref:DUF4145 domain-containing protein n=1 Tax=Streptomyces sp. NPDC015680 TaxID=3364962 RepID=UPI0036FA273C
MATTTCGWCGKLTHMTMASDVFALPSEYGYSGQEQTTCAAAFRCDNESCQRLSIGYTTLGDRPRAQTDMRQQLNRLHLDWSPNAVTRPPFPDVPEQIANTASEAHACLSIGAARGAVALARAVVEATAKAKGINSGGIVGKINALRDGKIISPLTADTSHQIREDGNSIAHGDIGDEPISQDDAAAILQFMDALLDEVFQRPAKLQRLKRRHEDRKNGQGEAEIPAPGRSGADFSSGL